MQLRKNKLLSDLRNDEIEYFSNELELNKSDISKCWNVLKDIIFWFQFEINWLVRPRPILILFHMLIILSEVSPNEVRQIIVIK